LNFPSVVLPGNGGAKAIQRSSGVSRWNACERLEDSDRDSAAMRTHEAGLKRKRRTGWQDWRAYPQPTASRHQDQGCSMRIKQTSITRYVQCELSGAGSEWFGESRMTLIKDERRKPQDLEVGERRKPRIENLVRSAGHA